MAAGAGHRGAGCRNALARAQTRTANRGGRERRQRGAAQGGGGAFGFRGVHLPEHARVRWCKGRETGRKLSPISQGAEAIGKAAQASSQRDWRLRRASEEKSE